MVLNPRPPMQAPPGSAMLDPPRQAKPVMVCSRCRRSAGSAPSAWSGGQPICSTCRAHRSRTAWLFSILAVMVALLGVGVVRGGHWLSSGAALLRAQRLVEDEDWHESSAELTATLREAPQCTDAQLLRIQAALVSDDLEVAKRLIEEAHLDQQTGPRAATVRALAARHREAMAAFDQGTAALKRNRFSQALEFLAQARDAFPESRKIQLQYLTCQAAWRFERNDMAGYLQSTRQAADLAPDDPLQQAMVASALAAQFAATGDPRVRDQCEEQLERAEALCRTESQRKDMAEYREQVLRQLGPRSGRRAQR